MKCIDVEGMRVVTNDKHSAEQIKKRLNIARARVSIEQEGEGHRDGWTKSWKIWKSGKGTKFEERRDGWSQKWKIWKNWKITVNDDETKSQSEKRVCK